MRIAVDAMGGDHAPQAIVAGAVKALAHVAADTTIVLVGDESRIRAELGGNPPDRIEVAHASQVVEMSDSPATAIRRKKDSSIARSLEMVKEGKADALFSAGNTGAAVAVATLKLRTLSGVTRPAIATVFPTPTKPFVLLDAGANTDSNARMLAEFALMGEVYSRDILGVAKPKVGLLSIGEEDAKGNDTTKEAFRMLQQVEGIDFVGNVESRDLFEGRVDVVSADGFVGNVVLKTSEAVAGAMQQWLKKAFTANPVRTMGAALLKPAFREIKETCDPEAHGGAPLLGARGVVISGHGSSSPTAVRNGIQVAAEAVSHHVNDHIEKAISVLQKASE